MPDVREQDDPNAHPSSTGYGQSDDNSDRPDLPMTNTSAAKASEAVRVTTTRTTKKRTTKARPDNNKKGNNMTIAIPAAASLSAAEASQERYALRISERIAAEADKETAGAELADVLARIGAADPTVTAEHLIAAEGVVKLADLWLTGRVNAEAAAKAGLINVDLTAAEVVRDALVKHFTPDWVEVHVVARDVDAVSPSNARDSVLNLVQSEAGDNDGGVLSGVTVSVVFHRAAGVAKLDADHLDELLTRAKVRASVDVYPGSSTRADVDQAIIRVEAASAPVPTLALAPRAEVEVKGYLHQLAVALGRAVGNESLKAEDPHRQVTSVRMGEVEHHDHGEQTVRMRVGFSISPRIGFQPSELRSVLTERSGEMVRHVGRVVSVDDVVVKPAGDVTTGAAMHSMFAGGRAQGDVYGKAWTVSVDLTIAYRVAQ